MPAGKSLPSHGPEIAFQLSWRYNQRICKAASASVDVFSFPSSFAKFVRSIIRFTTVLVLVLSLGLHWALLQTVAWTGMIISYSRDASFTEAVSKTFDGEHPCPMCKMIKKGRAEEKEQQQQKQSIKPGSKMEIGLIWQSTPFYFSCDRETISYPNSNASIRSYEPPKPRPRWA